MNNLDAKCCEWRKRQPISLFHFEKLRKLRNQRNLKQTPTNVPITTRKASFFLENCHELNFGGERPSLQAGFRWLKRIFVETFRMEKQGFFVFIWSRKKAFANKSGVEISPSKCFLWELWIHLTRRSVLWHDMCDGKGHPFFESLFKSIVNILINKHIIDSYVSAGFKIFFI